MGEGHIHSHLLVSLGHLFKEIVRHADGLCPSGRGRGDIFPRIFSSLSSGHLFKEIDGGSLCYAVVSGLWFYGGFDIFSNKGHASC